MGYTEILFDIDNMIYLTKNPWKSRGILFVKINL